MTAADAINVAKVQKVHKGGFCLVIDALDIADGESAAIIGPSGSGKSTLMRLIAGLSSPDLGRVEIFGIPADQCFGKQRQIRTVFQDLALFPHLSVKEQLALSLKAIGEDDDPNGEQVEEMIDQLGLTDKGESLPSQLSGGQKQRLALGRALISQPRILLLDEPMTGLDYGYRVKLWKYVESLTASHDVTTIVVTHNPDVALARSTKVAVLVDGRCVRVGSPQKLYNDPRNEVVAQLLGAANIVDLDGRKLQVDPTDIVLSKTPLADLDYSYKGQLVHSEFRGTVVDFSVLVNGQVVKVRRSKADPSMRMAAELVAFSGGVVYLGWRKDAVRDLTEEVGDD